MSQLLPAGTALPPLPYLLAVLAGLALVAVGLRRRRPTVTPAVVTAFAPWMATGAAGYALYQAEAVPDAVAPLFGNPVVYATTFVVAGALWLAVADRSTNDWSLAGVPGVLAAIGTVFFLVLTAVGLRHALSTGTLALAGPARALVLSVVVAGGVWLAVRSWVGVTGLPGVLALFGHTLDGISTAQGIALGFGEQTPLSAALIEAGHGLPPATLFGEAWLFVLVKIAVATLVLFAFREYVRDEPGEGSLFLGLVAAVGFGPGVHNLLLFAIA
ncbi:MAG: DUF63 family protein [Halobacteriales archaeon]|nr:DUF63 family protein [Halobacteriales archaeon]